MGSSDTFIIISGGNFGNSKETVQVFSGEDQLCSEIVILTPHKIIGCKQLPISSNIFVRVVVSGLASNDFYFKTNDSQHSTLLWALIGPGICVLVLAIFGVLARKFFIKKLSISKLNTNPRFLISYEELEEEGNMLGSGAFGQVNRGKWRGTLVAVKKLHLTKIATSNTFFREVSVLK